jgi:hypothetical protein
LSAMMASEFNRQVNDLLEGLLSLQRGFKKF